jgi:hypothetical protein
MREIQSKYYSFLILMVKDNSVIPTRYELHPIQYLNRYLHMFIFA